MTLYDPLTPDQLKRLSRKKEEIQRLCYAVYCIDLGLTESPGDENLLEIRAGEARRIVQQLDQEIFSLMTLCGILRRDNIPRVAVPVPGDSKFIRPANLDDL